MANFEVVLANGKDVNANRSDNVDLFKALKGGLANFGVVTRFDLKTTPSTFAWGGSRIHDKSVADQAAAGIVDFTNRNYEHRRAAHFVLRVHNTVGLQDIGAITVTVDTESKKKPPIFEEILKIPAHTDLLDLKSLGDMAKDGIDPTHDRVHWFTLTFLNNIDIVKKTVSYMKEFSQN